MTQCDIGLLGLAVMGQNLVLNMERNGFRVAVYNRTVARTDEFVKGPASGKNIYPVYDFDDLFAVLKKPRIIMLMVKAGSAVDDLLLALKPYLQPGDVIIDGGNSFYKDTERRSAVLGAEGLYYFGVGISGGEEGALNGPSIMPGGPQPAYGLIEPIFKAISAKVEGEPCATYLGRGGAGHYVKMVHNGIEYGDMQLIAEVYDLLKRGLGLDPTQLQEVFARWNEGVLSSYLIEITARIFSRVDEITGQPLVNLILDQAGQKGTGKWTSQDALDQGVAVPTLNAAVDARNLSAIQQERTSASTMLPYPVAPFKGDIDEFIAAAGDALYASKICSYAQGMSLLRIASQVLDYAYNPGEIARIWRGGCIIRARFLNDVTAAFAADPELPNLLLAPFFRDALLARQTAWRRVLQTAIGMGIPTPAMSASLAYFDSYRSQRLPANLIQAQRDFFGAHTYERIDRPGTFHTDWLA